MAAKKTAANKPPRKPRLGPGRQLRHKAPKTAAQLPSDNVRSTLTSSSPAAPAAALCRPQGRRRPKAPSRSLRRSAAPRASAAFRRRPDQRYPPADVAALKRVIEAAHKGKDEDADAAEKRITDPVARKLAEWAILRSDNSNPGFRRYADFAAANPSWPHATLFRKRAEAALWNDRADDRTVRAFFGKHAAADRQRALRAGAGVARPRRPRARRRARALSLANRTARDEIETRVIAMFGDMLTAADHKARMDRRFYADDVAAGLRAAKRIGGGEVTLAQAWAAVMQAPATPRRCSTRCRPRRAAKPAISSRARIGCAKNNKLEEAGKLILSAPTKSGCASISTSGGTSGACWCASCSTSATRKPPIASRAKRRRRSGATSASSAFHRRLDRAALPARSQDRRRAFRAHRRRHRTTRTRSARGGYWQGRAAEAMGEHGQAKRSTKWPRNTPPPITASSPARGSGCPISACAGRRRSRRRSRAT